MRIGIKFCGGCQSKYDRGYAYEKIISIKKVFFEYAEKKRSYDILVVISGCQIQCADISDYQAETIVHIYNENYEKADELMMQSIKSLLKKNEISSENRNCINLIIMQRHESRKRRKK